MSLHDCPPRLAQKHGDCVFEVAQEKVEALGDVPGQNEKQEARKKPRQKVWGGEEITMLITSAGRIMDDHEREAWITAVLIDYLRNSGDGTEWAKVMNVFRRWMEGK